MKYNYIKALEYGVVEIYSYLWEIVFYEILKHKNYAK